METRSQAAARRAREAESGIDGVDMDSNQLQPDHQGHRDSASTSTSATTVIMSTPEETQLFSARLNQKTKEASIKSASSRAPSSKKVERMKERLKLEEEAVKMRLQLNEIRIHQLNLEDDEDSAADLSEEEIPASKRTEEWVDAQSHVSLPPTFTNYDTIVNQTEFGFGRQEQGFRFGNGDSAIKKETVPPPPPLRRKPESVPVASATFVPERQQFYNFPQAPPPDPIAALTTALQAIMVQPQQTMDKYLARQTLGKDLPFFSGDVEEWQAFISNFRTSTVECQINDSQNLVRLQKCLKGQAREAVKALLVSPYNVGEILRVLEKQFGQPTTIIRSLMKKTRDCPEADEGDPDTLIKFGGTVRNLVKTVEALGKRQYLQNPQLLEELTDKLPMGLRLQWAKVVVNNQPMEATLTDFAKWLETITDAALVLNRSVTSSVQDTEKKMEKKVRAKPAKKTNPMFATEERDGQRLKVKSCSCCDKQDHEIMMCPKFKKMNVVERSEFATSKRLCYRCLKVGHGSRVCWSKSECGVDGCARLHNKLLHNEEETENSTAAILENPVDNDDDNDEDCEINGHINALSRSVLLRIIPVTLKGPNGTIKAHAMCDEASTVSLLDNNIANRLGLEGQADPLKLQWTDSSSQEDKTSKRVKLGIRGVNGGSFHEMQNVRTVKKMSLPVQSVAVGKLQEKWKHLQHVNFPEMKKIKPCLLIGQDHIDLIIARELREGPRNAPVASRTKLGWIIHGNNGGRVGRVDPNFTCCSFEIDKELHQLVKDSFSIDALGVKVNSSNMKSKHDKRAESMMESYTVRLDHGFEAPLLWKEDNIVLPNNKQQALKRLYFIEKKMDRNPEFALEYCNKIQYYVDHGYARKLCPEEMKKVQPKTWYLPHFFAYHPNKPGKPRFVFDAAACYQGHSLNNNLITGPDILKSLPGVLMRFREKRIAFTADIKEMFHQVKIRKPDQDSQRFLWRGMKRNETPETYIMQVMIFGAACSPYVAQYIKNRNALEFVEEFPKAVDSIINHHYVDDLADGAEEEEEATEVIEDIIHVHRQGGFEITKWSCSSKTVLEKIPEELRADGDKIMDIKSGVSFQRVLGLKWNPREDCFQFNTKFSKVQNEVIVGTRIPTKREVLKTVMSVYDPLGFLSHFLVKAKILYQNIWKKNLDWDEQIDVQQQVLWKKWIDLLPDVGKLKIPRHVFLGEKMKSCQLHMFCDASAEAYAAMGYLRYEIGTIVKVVLVLGKARVAPLKPQSIPRLELQSALLATRMADFIKEEQNLQISSVTYWTDAKTVVLWLRSDVNRYKQYVAQRVGEILERSNAGEWRWLPTRENVADEATRSTSGIRMEYDTRWFMGPAFLYRDEQDWPKEKILIVHDPEELELKNEYCAVIDSTVLARDIPDVTRFSSWTKLIRTTAWVRKFVRKRFGIGEQPVSHELTVRDLMWAQKRWWITVQKECFPIEYQLLKEGKSIQNGSRIKFLSPFIDKDGVLRVSSRTVHSPELSFYQKEPVILDPSHLYTKLLIRQYHKWSLHQGQEMVLNELRQRYWILRMRAAVKSIWNSCLQCRQRKSTPIAPEMGPLPAFRVTKPCRPFTICGIDYFGPLTVTKFRRKEKRWCALFTCMHTRAIHLELVDHLTTDSVIMALTRMASVRGWPKTFYSDNGTNFRGAVTELNRSLKELDQTKILSELAVKEVDWHFIPPLSPHFGGAWERMVRNVKRALDVILTEQAPREETLRTLLAEAVNIVNSRPLTYVPAGNDDPDVLTPNCFLFGTTSAAPQLGEFHDRDLCLRKQWRLAQRLADHFWRRWVREYLPSLTRKTKWTKQSTPIKVNDIVVIVDDNMPRNVWPKGVVEKVFPGKDGVIRVAEVKTKHGTFRRPVLKLCILDIGQEDSVADASGTAGGACSRMQDGRRQ